MAHWKLDFFRQVAFERVLAEEQEEQRRKKS